MGKNRDRLSIIAEILEIANSGVIKTRIMFGVNLSFKLLEKYLGVVVDAGFVRVDGSMFVLTERGRAFLRQYRDFLGRYIVVQQTLEALDYERKSLTLMCEPVGEPSGVSTFESEQKRVRQKVR